MLRGFATVTFFTDDPEEAGRWYGELTGVQPYFRVYNPHYLEFVSHA